MEIKSVNIDGNIICPYCNRSLDKTVWRYECKTCNLFFDAMEINGVNYFLPDKIEPQAGQNFTTQEPEQVNHPRHYNMLPSKVECIDVIEHFNFNLGSALKYIWRCYHKQNLVQDIKKAIWYLQQELRRIENYESNKNNTNTLPNCEYCINNQNASCPLLNLSVAGKITVCEKFERNNING